MDCVCGLPTKTPIRIKDSSTWNQHNVGVQTHGGQNPLKCRNNL